MFSKAEIGTDLVKAKAHLESNNVVAIPTETVYGLAGNALNETAITQIFKVKERPYFDPLIVHIANFEQLDKYCSEVPAKAVALAKAFWPGPLTLLLPKRDIIPDLITAGMDRVAIRIPNHPLTLALLNTLTFPLAAPSANPFGYISPTTPQHVFDQLGSKIPYILDGGACGVGVESTIVGFDNNETVIYRLGGLSLEAIEKVIGKVVYNPKIENNPDAPGMLKSHYAPKKPLYLTENIESLYKSFKDKKIAVLSYNKAYLELQTVANIVLSKNSDTDEAAQHLFAAMRTLDNSEADIIIAEKLPETGLGPAINDRLQKAAYKS